VTPQAVSQSICLRACSACSGDYEDPERTTWSDVSEEEDREESTTDNAEQSGPREEFPAREQ